MTYPPRRRPPKRTISRREALGILGASVMGAACIVSGGAAGILLLLEQDRTRPVSITEVPSQTPQTPEFTPTPDVLAPPMVTRDAWGALPPNHNAPFENGFYSADNLTGWEVYAGDLAEVYQTAVIHHSVEYEADDLSTVRFIQDLHRNNRGWADVAYHYFVGKSGTIYEGRDIAVRGTHVSSHNTGSAGVCLLGNFMQQSPTAAQIEAAGQLVEWLAYRLELSHLASHQDFDKSTQCPGDNLLLYMDELSTRAGLLRGSGGYVPPDTEDSGVNSCPCCRCVV